MLRATPIFLVLLLTSVTSLHASDGRVEINQDSVQASGGFPIEITTPGSYGTTV